MTACVLVAALAAVSKYTYKNFLYFCQFFLPLVFNHFITKLVSMRGLIAAHH